MASPTIEIRGDVYIPLCDKERCQEKLQKLAKALEEKHLTCVTEDQIIGTFERWFRTAFENCAYTIIHRCRHLWDKISIFESRFSDVDLKVMAVDLSTKARSRNDIPRSNSGLNNFFNKFSTTNISDDKSFNTFVLKVMKLFPEVTKHSKLSPDVMSQQPQRESLTLLQGDDPGRDTTIENLDIFKAYPDLFGHATNVFLQESCVACTPQETADCRDLFFSKKGINIEKLAKWQDDVKEKYSPNKKCVIHRKPYFNNIKLKLLPELFEAQKINELISIASCWEPSLQGEAMILLETILLSRRPNDGRFSFNTQLILENFLFEKLSLELDQTDAAVDDKGAFVLTERLSLLYVMVLSDTIVSRGMDEMQRCDTHLSTIIARSRKFKKAANYLQVFIEEASKKSCSEMNSIISTFINQPHTEGLGAKLCNENSVIQACVIIETMKLIFNSLNVKQLELLYDYIKNATSNEHIEVPSASLTLLARCLTIFLWFGLKHSKHQNLEDIYKKSSEIINLYLKWKLTKDMYRFIQILLFDNNPVIQKEIFKSKTYVDGSYRDCYGKNQLPFLISHMEKLLSPLLFIERDESDNPELKTKATEDQWQLMKAKFSGHDALVRVCIPDERSHRDKNDDIYCREMRVLQKLQHKNIIKMFAFQETHIPLFYVVEHIQINLQTALKYKKDNQDFYRQTSLFKFLVDALSAIEYCHSKLHVHCNLTCESLLVVDDRMAKLCGFHLCLELVDGRGKIDKKNSKKVPIPTRWTAPESLTEAEYTTASDVWMFGHLMYEVLTHGQLPYSQIEKIDDVSEKISRDEISLPENPSFKKEHYGLICECTNYKPNSRSLVNKIKMQLNQFLHDSEKTPSSLASVYPFDSFHKQSTESEKGIPDLPSSKYFEDQQQLVGLSPVTISDTLIRFTDTDVYIFREKMFHQVTQNMEIKVEDGKLSDILPGIRIYQNHGEVHHIECRVPRSCQYSFLNMVFEKALGSSLKPYLDRLLQVADLLKKLHERLWILGDICASYLYFEQATQGLKIYVVSLAYLLPCEMEDTRSNPPENNHVCARAAPEVINGGIFSSRSDVYCFGHLMWEVLTAFDHLQENVEQFLIHIESTHTTCNEEYLKKVSEEWQKSHARPRCCSDSLFELILSCTVSASVRRITLDTLIHRLQRICEGLTDEHALEHSAETSA